MKTGKAMRRFLLIIIWSFFSSVLAVQTVEAADAMLGFNQKAQEHDQWCWAGSSQSVLEYYGTVLDQCAIANYAFGMSSCCGDTTFSWDDPCNYWNYMWGTSSYGTPNGSLKGILAHWGITSTTVYSFLAQSTCVSEINAGRPFVMRFGWTSGGGHFLDGFGYDSDGQYLHYMDPWPGNGYTLSLYTWVVSASDHAWTHTLQLTTSLPTCAYAFAYPYDWNASLWGVPASSIQQAYNAAGNGNTIFTRALGTIEQVDLNRGISVGLYGGTSCDFSSTVGATRLSGSLTVSSGSVEIGNFIIEP